MDGVLVDSEPAIKKLGALALKEFGIDAKPDEFTQFTGMGDDRFFGGVAELHGVKYDAAMKERAFEYYFDNPQEVIVYGWSEYLIRTLKRDGFKVAIASSSDKRKVRFNVGLVGAGENDLDAMLSGTDILHQKPDPEIFLKAAEKTNSDPAQCVVMEDSIAGVQAAKAAGMKCIAVTTSFSKAELILAGADYVTDDLMSAGEVIKNLLSKI